MSHREFEIEKLKKASQVGRNNFFYIISTYGNMSVSCSSSSSGVVVALMCLFASVVSAYDFVIRNNKTGSDGNYYREIRDGMLTKEWIGEMYQDSVFDASGRRLGLNQGYMFYFDNGTSSNYNNILFLGEGNEIYWMDGDIISASGIYEQYQGGTLELLVADNNVDPTVVGEITLVKPPPPSKKNDDDNSSDSAIKLRITSEGGYYFPITNANGDHIGQKFQNPITMPNSNTPNETVGINQGYSFLFPQNDYIDAVLGYSSLELVLGNRHFKFYEKDPEEEILVFNTHVIHGKNGLEQYSGTTFSEIVLSTDPSYISDITLTVPSEEGYGEEYMSKGPYDFRITAEGGFYDPILDINGKQIGERFQNPVFNASNIRIGTNQGYVFNFPSSNFAPSISHGNRLFYLEEGTLDVLNEVIVAASGIYSRYKGGRFNETIVSYNPVFVSEVILLESDSIKTTVDEEIIRDVTSDGSCRVYIPFKLFFVSLLIAEAVL